MLSLINNSSSYRLNQTTSTTDQENLKIERKNLTNIFKLVVKNLIDSTSASLKCVDDLDRNLICLSDFFDVFENILNHGFKGSKKGFYSTFQRGDYSSLLEIIETKVDTMGHNLRSINDMNEIKTTLGKLRAWLRILVMQKQLAENFSVLVQAKDSLSDVYESEALMLGDEAAMISGILIGLNGLDFSIDLKSIKNTLDLPIRPVNYSTYLREKIPDVVEKSLESDNSEEEAKKLYEILDQKNYLEELNKTMKSQMGALSKHASDVDELNEELKSEVMKYKLENLELLSRTESAEADKLKTEKEYKVKFESMFMDQMTERETFLKSKNGLDQMYIELQKKIVEETKVRISVENELKTQEMMKGELESALKLMDHGIVDKQNSINKLREQLDQVKAFNLELNGKLSGFDGEKKALVSELDECKDKVKAGTKEIEELKQKIKAGEESLKRKSDNYDRVSNEVSFLQKRREELEVDLSIEKNWRQELQAELANQIELVNQLNGNITNLHDYKKENQMLRIEMSNLKMSNLELERTLEEMGSKLGVSVVKMEDIKEVTKQLNEYKWEEDDQVSICKQCKSEFNVARRKHHCRRCGRIFCHDCSDNKMPLPSFSKPVRVCNPCYESMLQNCTK